MPVFEEASGRPANEFARPFDVERVRDREVLQEIAANGEERSGLAKRLGLESLERLAASLRMRRRAGGAILRVEGKLEARVVQSCVVTLDPVVSDLDVAFEVDFDVTAPRAGTAWAGEVEIDPLAEDAAEPLPPEGLDLGEVVAEQLALAIDPYPRAPGARLERSRAGESPDEERDEKPNPFAALRGIKRDGG